jgi:hypothetical protein
LILPASCSSGSLITEKKIIIYTDTLEDESENWKAEYLVNETHVFTTAGRKTHYSGKDKSSLTVTYKGNFSREESSKHFKYSYDAGSKNGSGDGFLDRNGCNYLIRPYSVRSSVGEQKNIFSHTITPICTPHRLIYIYHEGCGGIRLDENNTVKVTLEKDGKKEYLELK